MNPNVEFPERPLEWWATLFSYLGLLQEPQALLAYALIASEPQRELTVVRGKAKLYGGDGINTAQWREWVDDRVVNDLVLKEFDVEVRPYETTEETSLDGPMWGPVPIEPLQRAPEMMRAWLLWRNRLCMAAMTNVNAAAIDGNAMFDVEHQHLDPKRGTYSNIVSDASARAGGLAAPTVAELAREYELAQERLFENSIQPKDLNVVDAPGVEPSEQVTRYAVITTDNTTRAAFRRLLNEQDLVDGVTRTSNEHKGGFALLQYGAGAAGSPYYIVRATPGGPRPTMWAPINPPRVLEERNRDEFDDAYAGLRRVFGMRALGGARSAFAETVVRVDPS